MVEAFKTVLSVFGSRLLRSSGAARRWRVAQRTGLRAMSGAAPLPYPNVI
jgi:hypothetical protein